MGFRGVMMAETRTFEPIVRPVVLALETLLGEPIRVLDDGFVRVVDYMGDDTAIVQAARVSYGKGTRRVHEDRALIRYLMRHDHTTPFEMCEIKLHVRVPMDIWRQWIRHRTASVNEYSTRYSEAIGAAQRTEPGSWRTQSSVNRQGSDGVLPAEIGGRLSTEEAEFQDRARALYDDRLAAGVAREQARKDLPLATFTEAYWKINLHNLLHFLHLRMDYHAQQEIRAYATAIGEQIVSRWVPIAWEAFLDYRRRSTRLSRAESAIIAALSSDDAKTAMRLAEDEGWLPRTDQGQLKSNLERAEFEEKLSALGLRAPWARSEP
jgi:thymidylate synthase (FAD)